MPQANPSDFLDVIKLFIPIFAPLLAILLTGIVGVAIFRQTSPNLQIQITSSWIQNSFGLYLLIRAEIENISKIRVYKRRVEGGRFQILEHELTQVSVLSEWVPFSEGDIRPTEKPIHWREPFSIIDKTKHLDPGENIPVERLYRMGGRCCTNR